MIVPMKRVFVLCLEDAREAALKRLAALGAVQIEREVEESPAIAAAGAGVAAAEAARDALREAAANPDPYGLAVRRARPEDSDDPAVRHVLSVVCRWLDARDERKALEATLARFAPWGDFDPAAARALAAFISSYSSRQGWAHAPRLPLLPFSIAPKRQSPEIE